jgi:hypothetical protein
MQVAKFLFLLAICAVVLGCSTFTDGQRLRIKNSSTVPIENLTVIFLQERVVFGTIAPGAMSEYKIFPKGVYGYAAYEYKLNDKTVTQPVIDWVGESPIDGSTFTYTLDFNPARPQMQQIDLVTVTRDQ